MKIKNILMAIFALSFFSCSNDEDSGRKARKSRGGEGRAAKYEMSLVLHLYKAVEEYKAVLALMDEQEDMYDEIAEVYHSINAIHSDITQKQTGHIQALESLKAQVTALDEILSSVDWPEEVYERLAQIREEIDAIQEILSETGEEEEEPTPAEGDVEGSAEEPAPAEGATEEATPAHPSRENSKQKWGDVEGFAEESAPAEGATEEATPAHPSRENSKQKWGDVEGFAEESAPAEEAEGKEDAGQSGLQRVGEAVVKMILRDEAHKEQIQKDQAIIDAEDGVDSAEEATPAEGATEEPAVEGSADESAPVEEVTEEPAPVDDADSAEELAPAEDSPNEPAEEFSGVNVTVTPETIPVEVDVQVEINVEEDDN